MADIKNPSVFDVGKPLPEQFSKYFIGQAYLNPLTQVGGAIANVTFSPGCRNNWHIHHKGGQILLVTGGRGWYQEWAKLRSRSSPATSSISRPKSNIGTARRSTAGFRTLPLKFPPKILPTSGWSPSTMINTAS